MTNTSPMKYWRENKIWSSLLGKKGTIIFSTTIHSAPEQLYSYAPYPFALVEIEGKKYEFIGIPGEVLYPGDCVECVLRKTANVQLHEVIYYGIKIKKIHQN